MRYTYTHGGAHSYTLNIGNTAPTTDRLAFAFLRRDLILGLPTVKIGFTLSDSQLLLLCVIVSPKFSTLSVF